MRSSAILLDKSKGFNHLYRNFDELRNDFSELIECGAKD